jgi:hypothetical protein
VLWRMHACLRSHYLACGDANKARAAAKMFRGKFFSEAGGLEAQITDKLEGP